MASDTAISVFSSAAVALGIFISTLGGQSFTKFNNLLIGDILSVEPKKIGLLAVILLLLVVLWVFSLNKLMLSAIHPALADSRGIRVVLYEALFAVAIALVVTLSMSWVGLMVINSMLVLPGAAARNIARNMRQYHLISVLCALIAGIAGIMTSFEIGASAGATITLTATNGLFGSYYVGLDNAEAQANGVSLSITATDGIYTTTIEAEESGTYYFCWTSSWGDISLDVTIDDIPSDIRQTNVSKVVSVADGMLQLDGDNMKIVVFTVSGTKIAERVVAGHDAIRLDKGVYLVAVNGKVSKVLVK